MKKQAAFQSAHYNGIYMAILHGTCVVQQKDGGPIHVRHNGYATRSTAQAIRYALKELSYTCDIRIKYSIMYANSKQITSEGITLD